MENRKRAPQGRRGWDTAALGLILGYTLLYGILSFLRFDTFHARIDMSYYLRIIWGIGHGRPEVPLVRAPHFIGLHLEPVLLPLGALSAAGAPLPPLLLVLQAACAGLSAWPAYRLGARHLGQGAPALMAAALALLYPTVTVATLHDFHPVTLALPALLGTIDALDERRARRALLLGALALAMREDIALMLACLCLGHSLPRREARARGLALAILLLAYFFLYILVIQPRFLPAFGSYGLHFRDIGGERAHSGRQLLVLILRSPGPLLAHLLTIERLLYPARLLFPLCFLPLLAPRVLLGALPILLINLLSDFPRVRTIEAHYATAMVPFLVGAAIIGAGRIAGRLPRAPLLALMLLTVTAAHICHGASPLAWRSSRWSLDDFREERGGAAVRALLRTLPAHASVAAPPGILAHLAERPRALSPPAYGDGRPVDVVLSGDLLRR